MTAGLLVIVAAGVLAVAMGLWRAAADGRFRDVAATGRSAPRGAEPRRRSVLAGTPFEELLGERATLLQFSSAFCSPCRATWRVLEDVARVVPGVRHVEVDAEHHLELVRTLGVLRTPTTLVLDRGGRELTRASGAPTRQAVVASLKPLVE